MTNFLAKWPKMDWLLFSAIAILLIISCSILYSLSLNIGNSDFLIFKKQIFFALSGLILYFAIARINYNIWAIYNKLIYFVAAAILILVVVLGTTVRGTTGWFSLGVFNIQPVEFAKLALIITLAKYFSDHSREFKQFRQIIISGLMTLFYIILVLLQPDLGSAMVMFGTWFIMLLFTGVRRKHILVLILMGIVVATFAWFFYLKDYQKDRLQTFFNPSIDPQASGYNVIQSMVAVGSGNFFGRGLSLGSQSSLRFLPEPGTDFIFAVIAEDLGFFGTTLLLGFFLLIFYRLFSIVQKSPNDFGSFLVLALAAMLLVQIFINVGMNMGISPVTGIPLPLVSAGGSSIWAILIGLGLAQSVYSRS